MNEHEAGKLLSVLATIDPKLPAADDAGLLRRVWLGLLADVPADAAQRAVQDYYRSERYLSSREPVAPADIVQWWNARRRPNQHEQHGQRRLEASSARPPASAERVREIMSDLCAEMGWKPTHSVVLAVACPECGAEPEQPCRRTTRRGAVSAESHADRRAAADPRTDSARPAASQSDIESECDR